MRWAASDTRMMAVGTLSIAFMPSYGSIGLIAPLLVVAGRLFQGLSAGAEVGGVSVYLSEIARLGHKGFYVSWQGASQQVAVMFAAVVGLTADEMTRWGWRIPLLVGCSIIPFLFLLRRSLEETHEFRDRKRRPTSTEILRTLASNWKVVALGTMLSVMGTVSFYMITAYTPTFGSSVLHLAAKDNMMVTLCGGASNFFWLPLGGAVSDWTGRRSLLIGLAALTLRRCRGW
jgi:MFS transporter, MHS family, citrate/tricarballylate:H+ symporter